jgi:3-deoxy-7-phosphoheptulonate synthase
MMLRRTDDLRIDQIRPLVSPEIVIEELPVDDRVLGLVERSRRTVAQILSGADDRLLVVVGPCSIHDPTAALDYGRRLKTVAGRLERDLFVVMRVYFEKPRTTVGW